MSQAAEVVILAEDIRHRKMIRRYLTKKCNYSHHRIRDVEPRVLQGETAGLTFVRQQYPTEVATLRKVLSRHSAVLIVGADADDGTVDERIRDLDNRLQDSGDNRTGAAPIVFIVPRRNVETWMYFVAGNEVDETTDYNPQCRNFDDGEWAKNFVRFARNPLPGNCPDSLRRACEVELRKIPQA